MRKWRSILGVVLLLSASTVISADTFWQPVSWTTPDGVVMAGFYHPASKPRRLTWVLLHGLGSYKEEWEAFGRQVVRQGDGVFLYDARGHGQSVHRQPAGASVDYHQFITVGSGSSWDRMAQDLSGAVDLLQKRYSVVPGRVALGGASLGANVALACAAKRPEIPALILLSPGLEYAGVRTQEPFQRYGRRPVFLAASPDDRYAFQSVQALVSRRTDAACVAVPGEGAAHGVNMLNDQFSQRLLRWMNSLREKPQ